MEAKFKVGDRVVFTYDRPSQIEGYETDKIYTVRNVEYSERHDDYTLTTYESSAGGRWQWKFELDKNTIVTQILNDL